MKFSHLFLQAAFLCLFVTFFCAVSVPESQSAIYKYTNAEGVDCYTDNLRSVPARSRKKAVRIDAAEDKNPASVSDSAEIKKTGPEAEGAEVPAKGRGVFEDFDSRISGSRPLKAAIAVIALIAAFIVIRKIGEAVGAKKISILLRIAITVALLLYLSHLFSKEMTATFNGAREAADSVRELQESGDRKLTDTANELFPEGKKEK